MKQFVLIFLSLFFASAAIAKVGEVAAFKLDNGLEVAVIENHKAPVVLQMLYYKTGSVNDPIGKGGIAHLLEHLMFRGTNRVPDKEFNRLTDTYGAENNAYTTYNETGYYELVDVSKLELMMALEADRMMNLDISDEAFKAEMDIVLQERMQRYESQPVPLFYETMNELLWQDLPLARSVSGSPAEIKGLSRADALAFYQRWYRPDNALLILSGDITLKEAKVLAKKYYGGLTAKGELPKIAPETGRVHQSDIVMRLKGVQEDRFVSLLRLEAGALSKKDVLALELLSEYLAGDDTAFLYEKLVYQDNFLLGISAGVNYDEGLGGVFTLSATPATDNADLTVLTGKINDAMVNGVKLLTEEKLEKVKNRVLSGVVYLEENPEAAARFTGGLLLAGYSADEVAHYDDLVRAISLNDVLAAWQKVLTAAGRVNGYLTGEAE